ncbi:isoprenyl transferase [Bacteroidales bacterium OttesenSCG-928-M11]|nr:isoprenyl transferase [Bacteroidales bacterium OttesenSCG-928-M11]
MKELIDKTNIPKHIAIIMDGNGRWAQKNGMERYMGHQEGVVSVRKVVETAADIGVDYLTVYTFSIENWNRPQAEVNSLMELMVIAIRRETPDLMKNNVRLQVIGDVDRLPESTRKNLLESIEQTKNNTGLTLVLALSYSSRWEIVEAVKDIAKDVSSGQLDVNKIDETLFSRYLKTKDIPDPDLLIRTGGEIRTSNYLLWQTAYTEFYFTDIYWPEFRENDLYKAILDYQSRQRRFGKTGEQVK